MLDREQRALLVVPYTPPPPPVGGLVAAVLFTFLGAVAVLGLAMAEYSTTVTVWLVLAATTGFVAGVGLFVGSIRARRQFRWEMERAVEPVPVQPAGDPPGAVEAG
jgi:amino acid transporter